VNLNNGINNQVPHNQEAEESVIGSLLIGGDMSRLILEPSDFFSSDMGCLYQSCINLNSRGSAIDQITVSDELNRMSKYKEVGGAAILSKLIANTPTSLDLLYYADIVKRLSMFRKLIQVGSSISKLGYNSEGEVSSNLADADKMLLELRKSGSGITVLSPEERVQKQSNRYDELYKLGVNIAMPTGLLDLDFQLGGGLFPGDLIIIGARPGMGKTTLLQQIANSNAIANPVLFASGEMNADSLTDREVSTMLKIPITRVRSGNYDSDMYVNITGSLDNIRNRKLYLYVGSRENKFNTANVYQAALAVQLRYGLAMIVVDYLSLLQDLQGSKQVDRLGYISAELKTIAMELQVPVVCAHQLNRGTETQDDKRPQLHNLRDSGSIEQDADIVLFIYRDNYYNKSNNNTTQIIIAKQRQGAGVAERVVDVYFDIHDQTYKNITGISGI